MAKDFDRRPADELERQEQLTCHLVHERLKFGDRPETPRQVEHSAMFRSRAAARSAADELVALGYRVTSSWRYWLRINLEFTHVTAVDHDSAIAFTREVVGVVDRHGGRYDGWGAFLDTEPGDVEDPAAAT